MTHLWEYYCTITLAKEFVNNSIFLIQNLLNQLLCYTDKKDSCLFVAETV